jgi:hypothetical protein
MRYGENPHQKAAFYAELSPKEVCIATATQLQGKALSYNNVADTDAALECVKSFNDSPACVIVKHANPCGVAIGENILTAYHRAFKTDPTSAFGGIIAFNRALDAQTAKAIIDRQFVEVIIAPKIAEEAKPILATKTNVRVLTWENPPFNKGDIGKTLDFKRVNGGLLVQERDLGVITAADLKIVTERQPTEKELQDFLFAWKVVKFVKSNAIVYCKDGMTIGIGAGQLTLLLTWALLPLFNPVDQCATKKLSRRRMNMISQWCSQECVILGIDFCAFFGVQRFSFVRILVLVPKAEVLDSRIKLFDFKQYRDCIYSIKSPVFRLTTVTTRIVYKKGLKTLTTRIIYKKGLKTLTRLETKRD